MWCAYQDTPDFIHSRPLYSMRSNPRSLHSFFLFLFPCWFLHFRASFSLFFSRAGTMLVSLAFFTLLSTVLAQQNDWFTPCLEGECYWDLPESSNTTGTMRVAGASSAISDITNAAGWTILDCDAKSFAQDIRLVCTGNDDDCAHLFSGHGAVHTLVRLPEDCGASPFARVARSWVHSNQSLPANVAKEIARKMRRRSGTGVAPKVQGLAIDTQFDAAEPASGNVTVQILGTTIPGQQGNLTITPPTNSTTPSRRGLFGFIESAFQKFNSFDKTVTKTLTPVNIDKTVTLLSASVSCPTPVVSAGVTATAEGKVQATMSVGAVAEGTIIPPKLTDFGAFIGLDADMKGTINLKGSATGTFNTDTLTLFSAGLPGLDFPGVLSVGPTFKVSAVAGASLDIDMDATITLDYNIANAKLFFPKSTSVSSGGGFTIGDSPLSLGVAPDVSANAGINAHLIPEIDLGVSGLGGLAAATIDLKLDASASMGANVSASAGATASTGGSSTSASASGCVTAGAELNVSAGASANFFDLFDPSTSVSLFDKKFSLLSKCFGDAKAPTRRGVPVESRRLRRLPRNSRARALPVVETSLTKRVALDCPSSVSSIVSALNEAVPANSISS
ncbi:hypothetical protein HMN09_01068000 [Mycena chlorophos]|uniref:DUF7223 domain-containing protein n=1 Tax=Mycena chlorophos TaxID=658473 RepID=A0A8H6W259_MYCCL|nr:hypothetical protein HMN09_01068000 [Mycena chlorophos]